MNNTIIILLIGFLVLGFSIGLITGLAQGNDLREYYTNEIINCWNNSAMSEFDNYNIDSSENLEKNNDGTLYSIQ